MLASRTLNSNIPLLELLILSLCSSQLLPQQRYLGSIGVPVDNRLVADVARPVGIAQGLSALIDVDVSRADTCNHGRLGVPSQRVLHTCLGTLLDRMKLMAEMLHLLRLHVLSAHKISACGKYT